MSGHNKWSKVKHKKAALDAKKSQEFGRLSKLIYAESRRSGGDKSSPGLSGAIVKAKSANMPNENIERAVARGAGKGAEVLESVVFEAYGPGGAALLIEAETDNKNRTVAEIKHMLIKNNSSLAASGAAAWAFEKSGDGYEAKTKIKLSKADSSAIQKMIEELGGLSDVEAIYVNI